MTPRTRFALPVHLYGQMADMRALEALAYGAELDVIEDACQAHGATRDGYTAGAGGLAAAFSFCPGKNLGAFGDAGALVIRDAQLASRVSTLREHGQREKYRHAVEGWTSRLDTIQALVLLKKLPFLDAWNEERRGIARFYGEALEGVGDVRLPPVGPRSRPVWHVYPLRTAHPARMLGFLAERGVRTGRHYPEPPHLTDAYAWLGHRSGSFPVAEALCREEISLPLYPGMNEAQTQAVVDGIRAYFRLGR